MELIVKNIASEYVDSIKSFSKTWGYNYLDLKVFFDDIFNIDCSTDPEIIDPYKRDWSNIPGDADILFRPNNELQCAIILKTCFFL